VERVADDIAVIQDGKLRARCSIEEFSSRIRTYVLRFKERPPSLPDRPWLLQSFRTDHELSITVANPGEESRLFMEKLGAESLEETEVGLEDAFISYVGERGEKTFFLQTNGASK
jgi:ABC-2 type transport system ATP-binding protein